MQTKFVYSFSEGNKDLKDLLGGKGANLAEMMRIGIPVPPGFTITTEACKEYLSKGAAPLELEIQITKRFASLKMRCRSVWEIKKIHFLYQFVPEQSSQCQE